MSGEGRELELPPGGGYPGVDGVAETWGDSPLNRLATAVRRVTAVGVGQPLDDDIVSEAAAEVEAVADLLERAAEADGLAHELEIGWPIFASNDAAEGQKAFAEKRPPNYTRT